MIYLKNDPKSYNNPPPRIITAGIKRAFTKKPTKATMSSKPSSQKENFNSFHKSQMIKIAINKLIY